MSEHEIGLNGLRGRAEATVRDTDTAISLGSGDLPVLGTPRVVALMEAAAISAIANKLDPRLTTVGTGLDVRHTAPSRVGAIVLVDAHIADVHGRTIVFEVVASCDGQEIASGRHVRVIVDRTQFLSKLEERAPTNGC
jgi:predicted thioesterase